MPRKMLDIKGVSQAFPFTRDQIYKLVRKPEDPLPHRKVGRNLLFDEAELWKWFDRQPGRRGTDLNIG